MSEIEIINEKNFKFSKKFGQNFIFDKNLLEAIVADSKINKDDEVLEIGPGAGTLTKIIAKSCKYVCSYEIDNNLKPILEENLKDSANSKVIFKDALKTPLEEIEKNFSGQYKLVANLPYYITTPLIFKFVGKSSRVQTMSIMVQKEVGERLTAKSGDKNYGSISVILDFYGDVKILRNVNRQMFHPVPNVDSCVVQINLKDGKFDCNSDIFEKVVKSAFSNRRKTLVNNLSKDFNLSKNNIVCLLEECNLDTNVRGDGINTYDFVKIAQKIDKFS